VIVVDASVLIGRVLNEPVYLTAVTAATSATPIDALHAPELIELEVLQTLRRMIRGKALTPGDAGAALANLAATRLRRHGHAALRGRVWQLRDRLTAYDAAYVVLAERLRADLLLTADKGMAAVAQDVLGAARVRLV